MTKKHFIALATTLKLNRPNRDDFQNMSRLKDEEFAYATAMNLWRDTVRGICSVCYETNPNFRRSTFLDACGFDD